MSACTICTHVDLYAINGAIVAQVPNRRMAAQYLVSEQAVRRHKKAGHLPMTLVKATEAAQVVEADNLLEQVRRLQKKAMSILDSAEESGELRTALAAIREARGNLELLAKMVGELDERPQVNINISQEWVNIRTTILLALESHPDAKHAVVEALNGHGS